MTLTKQEDGSIKIRQPQIIQSIIDEVPIAPHLKDKATPLATSKPVLRGVDAPKFNHCFHYRRVIDWREPHAAAVEHLVQYLRATADKGMILRPNPEQAFN
eukprot:4737890-Ditylum_brightwellii.AAC.1